MKYIAKVKDWNTGEYINISIEARSKRYAKWLVENSLAGRAQKWKAKIIKKKEAVEK